MKTLWYNGGLLGFDPQTIGFTGIWPTNGMKNWFQATWELEWQRYTLDYQQNGYATVKDGVLKLAMWLLM